MLDFLRWMGTVVKGNAGSHIPQTQRQIILLDLHILLILHQTG